MTSWQAGTVAALAAAVALSGCLLRAPAQPLTAGYEIGFATYVGGSDQGQVRDVAVDREGNVYLTGGAGSQDFPRTMGPAHQGSYDVFVTKYSPTGQLLRSRLIGGPICLGGSDIEYGDTRNGTLAPGGSIIVAATTKSADFPVTTGAAQGQLAGAKNGLLVQFKPHQQ